MFPGSVIPPPRPPTNFIAPALRHQIVAAVVDTPMSCAAPHNGTSRHTWSNNLRRTALECGYPLGIATSKSTDVADWQRALFRTCGIPSAGRCLVSVRRQDPFVIRSAARARTKPALIPAVVATRAQITARSTSEASLVLLHQTRRRPYLAALRRGSGEGAWLNNREGG